MNKFLKVVGIWSIVAIVFSMSLLAPMQTQAAGQLGLISVLLKATDSETGNNVYAVSSQVPYTFVKFTPIADLEIDDGIKVTFTSFTDSVETADVTVTQNAESLTKTVVASGGSGVIQIEMDSATTGSKVSPVTVKITGDATDLVTPGSANTYTVNIEVYDLGADAHFGGGDDVLQDSGAAGVIIGTAAGYQIGITGTVDPTLSMALTQIGNDTPTSTCALGTLTKDFVETCGYDAKISTNATGGYTAYIRAGGGLMSGANEIDKVAEGDDIDFGVEEYGISSSDTGTDIINNNSGTSCTLLDHTTTPAMPADPLTNGGGLYVDRSFASSTGTASNERTTVCHAAGITAVTPAGNYTQTVTITIVGNF
ncbi:MAG: hypothetical protein NTZ49_03375 [Candidatus Parcubacteria bacterium]|nr:hypothetical protein [Candidatus Parcubacteria bacterium]